MSEADRDVAVTLAAAAVLGLAAGLASPAHQVAIETAQVLAGSVAYPPDNAFGVYHHDLWNLPSQLLALLLRAGLPERGLSVALGGVMGALSLAALALVALAMSRDRLLALAAPCWILAVGMYDLGVSYPIRLLGFPHTYGVIGTSYGLFALALLALGRRRSGFALLGLAPAVHPTIGSWCLGVGLLAFLFGGAGARAQLRAGAAFLAAGFAATLASFGAQVWMGRSLALEPPPDVELVVRAFVRHWDFHRMAIPVTHPVLLLTLGFVTLALAWLRVPRLRADLAPEGVFLLRAIAVSAALGGALCALTPWQEHFPLALLAAMPGRHVNLSGLALAALLIGLLGRYRRSLGPFFLAALVLLNIATLPEPPLSPVPVAQLIRIEVAVALLALLRIFSPATADPAQPATQLGEGARVVALLGFAGVALMRLRVDVPILLGVLAAMVGLALVLDPRARGIPRRLSATSVRAAAAALVVLATLACGLRIARVWGSPLEWLGDRANDAFLEQVGAGTGLLLTAGDLSLIQLRTRRPVLLDGGGLDGLNYAPGTAPVMARIVHEVYGEKLDEPSRAIQRHRPSALLPDTGRQLWRDRTPADWRRLAEEFGFTEILVPSDWELALPRVAEGSGFALYRVSPD